MTDAPIWDRAEPESPCTKVCTIHPDTRLCLGCRRSLDEIAAWSGMTPEARRAVLAALPGRSASPGRAGGRAGRAGR